MSIAGLLVNIDVPDLAAGETFYTAALGLTVGRRLGEGAVELLGAGAPIYLLEKAGGSRIGPGGGDVRRYERHWTPVHLDIVVSDMATAIDRAVAAGAVQEAATQDAAYGQLALFADPFGHGFCLIAFNAAGYDAIATAGRAAQGKESEG